MSLSKSGYEKFFKDARRQAVGSARAQNDQEPMTPEQMVRQHLAERTAQRKTKRRRRRPGAPIFASVLLMAAIASGVAGFWFPQSVEQLSLEKIMALAHRWGMPKIDLGFFGLANASESQGHDKAKEGAKDHAKEQSGNTSKDSAKATAKSNDSSAEPAKSSPATAEKSHDKSADPDATKEADGDLDVKHWTSEELSFFKKLNEKKQQLDRRETELAKLEEELQKQREGLEEKIKQLESMRKQISATLKDRVALDQEKVAKLVDVYSNMKPNQAAKIIESLNEDLAMTILDKMKKKNAAEILNMMAAPKARKLSEMLTGYQTGPQTKSEGKADTGSKEDRQPSSTN